MLKPSPTFKTILLLTPMVLLGSLAFNIYITAIPKMSISLDTTLAKTQFTLNIHIIGIVFGQMLFGQIIDKFGRKNSLLLGTIIYTLASLICCSANNINQLLLARFFQSIGASACQIAAFAMVKDLFSYKQQARIYSYLGGIAGVGPILAPTLGAYLLKQFQFWQANFGFLTIIGLLSFFCASYLLKETLPQKAVNQRKTRSFKTHYGQILRDKQFLIYAWHLAFSGSILFLFYLFIPTIVTLQFGCSEPQLGYYLGLIACIVMGGNFICPKLNQKIGNFQTVFVGCCLITVAGGLLSYSWYFLGAVNVYTLLIPTFLASVGIGLIPGPATSNALYNLADSAGTATSLLWVIRHLTSFIMGVGIANYNIYSPILLGGILLTLGTITIMISMIMNQKFKVLPT